LAAEPARAYSGATSWTFDYSGAAEVFDPPTDGQYLLKVWGAQGGNGGGAGGYSLGVYQATNGTPLYVYVGSAGRNGYTYALDGYNGGGLTANMAQWYWGGVHHGNVEGATQTAGGYTSYLVSPGINCVNYLNTGTFGQGARGDRAGGGGGWYGGGASCLIGSGGSGYIGGVAVIADVEVGGVDCVSFAVVDDETITCVVPAGAVDVAVTGEQGSTETLAGAYIYDDFEPTISLSLSKLDVAISGTPNVLYTDYVVANVITNNPTGYHLDIEASQPDLVCASDGAYRITAVNEPSGTLINQWGYQLDDDGDEATVPSVWNWSGVTTQPAAFKTFPTDTDPTNGDDTVLWFGTKFILSIPACKYSGAVTISAITN
jgi:hypothetical protein